MLYEQIKENATPFGVAKACRTMGVSRSGYTTWLLEKPAEKDTALVKQMRAVAAEFVGYGYRRIAEAVSKPECPVNRKKVRRLMKLHGLQRKKRRFTIQTTDSKHGLPIYPNLAKSLVVTRLNQLWVADITFVWLVKEFVYLAIVLDVFSRRVIGWQLSKDIDSQLCLDALELAFKNRRGMSLTGLVHHSDQGVQYASNAYTEALEGCGVSISMSRKGNPYDNAFAESWMKTFKCEEVYVSEYVDFSDAYRNIGRFIERVYNGRRLHSGLGYLAPEVFEEQILRRVVA